jgi:hypothetical protein
MEKKNLQNGIGYIILDVYHYYDHYKWKIGQKVKEKLIFPKIESNQQHKHV